MSGQQKSGSKRSGKDAGLTDSNPRGSKRNNAKAAPSCGLNGESPLVKVGDGEYTPFKKDVSKLDRADLVEALALSKRFGNNFTDVKQDHCLVFVGAFDEEANDEPTEDDEQAVHKLSGGKIVKDLWADEELEGKLFLRVKLPKGQSKPVPAAAGSGAASSSSNAAASGGQPGLLECAPDSEEALWLAAILAHNGKGAHIKLAGAHWPTLLSSTLFKRNVYDPLVEGVLGGLNSSKTPEIPSYPGQHYWQFIILGNPGIGKSAFGLYLVYLAVRLGLTVVYQSRKLPDAWVIKGKKIYIVQGEVKHRAELKQRSTVFISDSITPPVVPALTILISSPAYKCYSEFQKEGGCTTLYLPTYSQQEMLQLRAACFSTQTVADVMERYKRWGGIVRYVLTKITPAEQLQLKAAVGRLQLEDLPSCFDTQDASEATQKVPDKGISVHHIVHHRTRGELGTTSR